MTVALFGKQSNKLYGIAESSKDAVVLMESLTRDDKHYGMRHCVRSSAVDVAGVSVWFVEWKKDKPLSKDRRLNV